MTLSEYVEKQVKLSGKNKTAVLKELAKASNVSLLTLQGVTRGATMQFYNKATQVSEATGGAVTVKELCEVKIAKAPRVVKKTAKK